MHTFPSRLALVVASSTLFVATSIFVLTACDDQTNDPRASSSSSSSSSGGSSGDAEAEGDVKDSGSSTKDTGGSSGKDASSDADATISGDALTIKDGQGRFTTRSFTDYTCPDVPGLGLVLRWTIPADIQAAVGLPAGATYYLQVEGAADKNVFIAGPPSDKKYFVGDQAVLITQTGTLPATVLTAVTPATGTVTVDGKWTCP